ncbi:MAG: hypothetical protein IPP94_18200 [Ignavibacteria bacterium]|nr:hypothetical protein [Ignavibacteria bacterium]
MIIADTGEAIGVQQYSVLSPAHLVDIANVLLLNLGVLLFLLLAIAVRGWRSIDRSDPALAVFGTAAVGGFPIWFAGQSYFGLGRDWDVMTAPVFAIAMLSVALLVRAHERKLIDLGRIAPFVIAIALSGLFLWLRPNMNAAASAARFEDLIAQNAPELLPRESFVAYEHLRKYYQSTGESEKTMRVLRSMAETKHLALESYRRVFIALANARHSEARERDFAWLLEHLVDDARHFGQLRPKDIGDARDFDEFATRAFIGAAQAGYPELVRRYQPQFEAARPAWTGAGLVRASGDAALSAEEAVSLLRASVTDSTRDAELLIIAAGAYQQKGMDDEAIAHVERALARQPVYYPKWYLALAGMYHQKGRVAEEADVLRRCVANCPGTPEAEEARRLLDTPAEAPARAR